ncbi:hypothetical protein OWM54_27525 [Myxococcus sp. MISCRS1]|uniref:hypothetical protein n=1 Tax=Myxococcus TaxID=32 RepID=UPI001CBB3511|nr:MULTISPECIES: hypothetical protein [unclassified Myxococcus]MBZ4396043.1 hypothetical protein [Myxococcus sp. AS-1-15]MBZ4408848.1 hypothetical protein [Myxococcus sp. XM-1-1-1]MCY1000908.1 hypothetical protein [Myxococcus sp. MISCRS1]BDT37534.1 hypothetical protein MFMH1_72030 [Myxococcus sp. MH1]
MSGMRIALLVGGLLLASGCVVHSRSEPRPGPSRPPPRPSSMSYKEAVDRGFGECRSRRYDCRLKEAHRTGRDVWKVKFEASAPGARGHLHLEYDAFSRNLLRVDEKVKARRDRDDDWDDDDHHHHGRGKGKKKGHAHRDD